MSYVDKPVEEALRSLKGVARENYIRTFAEAVEKLLRDYNIDADLIGYDPSEPEDFMLEHCSGLTRAECVSVVERMIIEKGGRKSIDKIAEEQADRFEHQYFMYIVEETRDRSIPEKALPETEFYEHFRSLIDPWVRRYLRERLSIIRDNLSKILPQDEASKVYNTLINYVNTSVADLIAQYTGSKLGEVFREYRRMVVDTKDPSKAYSHARDRVTKIFRPVIRSLAFYVINRVAEMVLNKSLVDLLPPGVTPTQFVSQAIAVKPIIPTPTPTPTPPPPPAPTPMPTPTPTPTPSPTPAPPLLAYISSLYQRPSPYLKQALKRFFAQEYVRRMSAFSVKELPEDLLKRVPASPITAMPITPPPAPREILVDMRFRIPDPGFLTITKFLMTLVERSKPPEEIDNMIAFRPEYESLYEYLYPLEALQYIIAWGREAGFEFEVYDTCISFLGEHYPTPSSGFLYIGFVPIVDYDVFQRVKSAMDFYTSFIISASERELSAEANRKMLAPALDLAFKTAVRFYNISSIVTPRYSPYIREIEPVLQGVAIGVGAHFRKMYVFTCGDASLKDKVKRYIEEETSLPTMIFYEEISPRPPMYIQSAQLSGVDISKIPPSILRSFIELVNEFTKPAPDRDPSPYADFLNRLPQAYYVSRESATEMIKAWYGMGLPLDVRNDCTTSLGELYTGGISSLNVLIGTEAVSISAVQRLMLYPPAKLFSVRSPTAGMRVDLMPGLPRMIVYACGDAELYTFIEYLRYTTPAVPMPIPSRKMIRGVEYYTQWTPLGLPSKPPSGSEPWIRYVADRIYLMRFIGQLHSKGYEALNTLAEAVRGCPKYIGNIDNLHIVVFATNVSAETIRSIVGVIDDKGSYAFINPIRGGIYVVADASERKYMFFTCY